MFYLCFNDFLYGILLHFESRFSYSYSKMLCQIYLPVMFEVYAITHDLVTFNVGVLIIGNK